MYYDDLKLITGEGIGRIKFEMKFDEVFYSYE